MKKPVSTVGRATIGFVSGFLATLLFHQFALWLLKAAGMTDRGPWQMSPVPPFGIPSVISLAFWGGVWGVILLFVLPRSAKAAYWVLALVIGAIGPTLVAGFVVAPLKGISVPADARGKMLLLGLIVNGAWGLGTALFARLMLRNRN